MIYILTVKEKDMRRKFDDYVYKTEPYDHQRSVLRDSWHRECYALFMEMGTGKSKIIVDTIGLLHEVGEIDTVLIVAPKGVFHNWVRKEIPTHLPDRIQHSVCAWQPNITKSTGMNSKRLSIQTS